MATAISIRQGSQDARVSFGSRRRGGQDKREGRRCKRASQILGTVGKFLMNVMGFPST